VFTLQRRSDIRVIEHTASAHVGESLCCHKLDMHSVPNTQRGRLAGHIVYYNVVIINNLMPA
jgi:hypothetical protein